MALLDILVLILAIGAAIIGLWRGFVYSVMNFFKGSTCFVISMLVAKPVTALLSVFKINEALGKVFKGANIVGMALSQEQFEAIKGAEASVSGTVVGENLTGKIGIVLKAFFSKLFSADISYVSYEDVVDKFCYAFGTIALVLISFLLVFILIRVLLNILNKIFTNEAGARRFGALDKILGMTFGLLKLFVSIVVTMIVVNTLAVVPIVGTAIDNMIAETKIVQTIYGWVTDGFLSVVTGLDFNALISSML